MLLHLLVWLIIIGLVFYLLYWAVSQIPLPAPWAVVIRVILALIAVVILLQVLLPLAGPIGGCSRLIGC